MPALRLRNLFTRTSQWLWFAVGMCAFGACTPPDSETPVAEPETGRLRIQAHITFNGQPLLPGTTGTDAQGAMFRVQHLGMYISGVELLQNGQPVYTTLPNAVALLTTANPNAVLEWPGIPTGSYDGIRFWVGVADSATNLQPPSTFHSAHPLFAQLPFMHWDTQRGYIFLRLDANTDVNQDGIPDAQVRYQIGTRPLLRQITAYEHLPITLTPVAETQLTAHIVLDSLLVGVVPRTQTVTFSNNFDTLALRLANNIPRMFR